MSTATESVMQTASVPKLAEIVKLLGGWGPILDDGRAMGAGYVLSLDKGVILIPDDDESDDEHDDKEEIVFPEDGSPGHTFKSLQINMIWEDELHWHIEVGLWGRTRGSMGDPYSERNWEFRVPKEGWESGRWYVYGTAVTAPFLGQWRETADQGAEKARELASDASGFDRENLIVDGCLALARGSRS
jgi:hypothetical protein